MNKGLMIHTGYRLHFHCYQPSCHISDDIYLQVFDSSYSRHDLQHQIYSNFQKIKLIAILIGYDSINFHTTIYYNMTMKYTIVVLALFMAHWKCILGCSGSKSQVSNRGMFGKKQLLQHSTMRGVVSFITDKQLT